jgi:hypothetical protein
MKWICKRIIKRCRTFSIISKRLKKYRRFGRMEFLATSLERLKMENFIHDVPLNSSSIPSMALQDSTKGRNTQRRR